MEDIEIKKFLYASQKIGNDINLVQGSGGNTSYKDGNILNIKASGLKLKNSLKENIFVKLNLSETINKIKSNEPLEGLNYDDNKNDLRPSIETSMHAIIPKRYVFHVHCLNSIAYLVQNGFEEKIRKILKDLNFAIIKYIKPGIDLTREIEKRLKNDSPEIFFLANHGLVVCNDNLEEAIKMIYYISNKLNTYRRDFVKINTDLLLNFSSGSPYKPAYFPEVNQLAATEDSIRISSQGSLYPDQVVFLGPDIIVIESKNDFKNLINKLNNPKFLPIILVKNHGVLVPKSISYEGEEMVLALSKIVSKIPKYTQINYLTKNQENELINWPAEIYRLNLNSP